MYAAEGIGGSPVECSPPPTGSGLKHKHTGQSPKVEGLCKLIGHIVT